ncbi:hypothetical protein BDR04DRAFT_1154845 [Suillus decipiens]|nr:hypothetical protein BDR04DRAFT_1154845 [Suillus decipiens]
MAPMKAPEKKSPKSRSGPPATHNSISLKSPLPQEDIETLSGAVMNSKSAEKYLVSVLLCQADEPLTLLHLVGILFQITQMVKPIPLSVTNAICVVAFLLKQQVVAEIAGVVAEFTVKHLLDTLSSSIVNSVVVAIAPQVAAVHSTAQNLQDTLDKSTKLYNSLEQEKTATTLTNSSPPPSNSLKTNSTTSPHSSSNAQHLHSQTFSPYLNPPTAPSQLQISLPPLTKQQPGLLFEPSRSYLTLH